MTIETTSSNVAHTNGVTVVVGAVSTYQIDGASLMDGTITIDYIVIADVVESSLLVPLSYVIHRVVTSLSRSAAMYDDFLYLSLGCLQLRKDLTIHPKKF